MNFNLNLLVLLVLVSASGCFSKALFSSSNDEEFATFLKNRMAEYGNWVIENNLDPSPVIPTENYLNRVSAPWGYLNCSVSNQVITGHSNVSVQDIIAVGNFSAHYYSIERYYGNQNNFTGEFTCNGVILASYDSNLGSNLVFSGTGNFTVRQSLINETEALENFGITEDYKFDLTQSIHKYKWKSASRSSLLNGVWDDTRATNYLSTLQSAFGTLYWSHVSRGALHLSPSRRLLVQYLQEVLSNVSLSDIISSGDLPPPYSPEPTTTTSVTGSTTKPTTVGTTTPTFGTITSTTPRPPTVGTTTRTTPAITTTNRPITHPPSTSSLPPPVGNSLFSCNYCTNYFNFTIVLNLVDSIRSKLN